MPLDLISLAFLLLVGPWLISSKDGDRSWFNNWLLNPDVWAEMEAAFQRGEPVQITNALRPEMAEKLWRSLYKMPESAWTMREMYEPGFAFHGHSMMSSDELKLPKRLQKFFKRLNSASVLQAAEGFSEGVGINEFHGLASWHKPGDFCGPHTDLARASHGGEKSSRRLAFVLHLAKDWKPEWGGDLIWMTPHRIFHSSFNALTVFPVSAQSSLHYITPVSRWAPENKKRLAVAGWWNTRDLRNPQLRGLETRIFNVSTGDGQATRVDGFRQAIKHAPPAKKKFTRKKSKQRSSSSKPSPVQVIHPSNRPQDDKNDL